MNVKRSEVATLAGGCFWCLEAVFARIDGVAQVVSGYCGGTVPHPTYEQVSTDQTGHAESVQIGFDPVTLPYAELLGIFFAFHDPTTPNRQGPDVGERYRSVIFWRSQAQKATAERVIADLGARRVFERPIVTQLVEYPVFYPAEQYHQDYYRWHGGQPYCRLVITPKVAKLRKMYAARLKAEI